MKFNFNKNKTNYSIFILSLILIVSCSNKDETQNPTNDVYLSIPDIHFETKLIEQGIDSDGIINQQILKSDAEAVSKLNLDLTDDFGEIFDLTGIEGFVNITLLSAARQKIKSVDLSFNTKLDTLFLYGNHLTNIDISNNSNLILLDIKSNELSSINGLSKLLHLKKINLSYNNFEEISIKNESIEDLLISDNLLKSIDTNDAKSLKNVLLTLNKLTEVDFSSNTLLETLLISGNKLQDMNIENNRSLTHLYSSNNLLTSLDVSNNQELIDLRVDRNLNLSCIKISSSQKISTVIISNYQELNTICN